MAVLAKALRKPFYALAESYKFLRLFPLSQADLPPLPSSSFSRPASSSKEPPTAGRPVLPLSDFSILPSPLASPASRSKPLSPATEDGPPADLRPPQGMTSDMLALNPRYDYTPRDAINLVVSDVGILTPDSVSSYLVIAE